MTDISKICRRTAVAAVLLPVFAWAGTGTWTGAQDGYWTNANNWAEGIVPGFTATDAATPNTDDTLRLTTRALFDGTHLNGKAVTTVDLDGLTDIAYLEFTGATTFTLGTGARQKLPIEDLGALVVLGTKPPVLNATVLKVTCNNRGYWDDSSRRPGFTITNNAPEELVISSFGGYTGTKNPSETALTLVGTGNVRFTGTFEKSPYTHFFPRFSSGRLIIDTAAALREVYCNLSGTTQ